MKFHNFAWALFSSAWFCVVVHGENSVFIDPGTEYFNLRKHLTTPLQSEIEAGVHKSRRLARNHIRLGIDEEHHRKLFPENPPDTLVTRFNASLQLPSTGPRLDIDSFSKPLPFGDGLGIQPSLPEGTREFWLGGGFPTKAWEVVACPVADVAGYLADPLSCVFSKDGNGTLMNLFVQAVEPETIGNVLTKGVVPLALEAFWSLSPWKKLADVLISVCDILEFIDSVINITERVEIVVGVVKDIVETTKKGVETVNNAKKGAQRFFKRVGRAIGDIFSASALGAENFQPGTEFAPCRNDHLDLCYNDTNVDCENCNYTIPEDCGDCRTCYRPFQQAIPDMDGICLETEGVKELTDPDVDFSPPTPPPPKKNNSRTRTKHMHSDCACADTWNTRCCLLDIIEDGFREHYDDIVRKRVVSDHNIYQIEDYCARQCSNKKMVCII